MPDHSSKRLATSTAVFGAATFASRVAGVFREAAASRAIGSGAAMSAFQIAFNIPNLIRSLFADNALSAAFVPIFVELRGEDREPEAWRVASIVFWMAALVLGGICALFMLAAPFVARVFAGGGASTSLVATLMQIMFPIVMLLGLTGVVTGVLNSYEVFGLPAFAPVVWNLVIIGFVSVGRSPRAYAWGVLIATVVQLAIPLGQLLWRGGRLPPVFEWATPHVGRILRLMLPVTIGLGLININLTIDMFVGNLHSAHVPANLNYAFRLFMLPQGLFSVAVATVLFPEIARLASARNLPGLIDRVAEGTRTIIFLLLPAAVISIVLAHPIVRVVYQGGRFHSGDTTAVSVILVAFSFGLVFNGLSLLLTRAFFALQEPRVPTQVACVNLVLNAVLDLALVGPFGGAGIAFSTSVVTAWNAAALAYLLRGRVGSLHFRAVAGESVRIVVATVYCAVAAFGSWWLLDRLLGVSMAAQLVAVGVALLAGGWCYLTAGRMLALADVAIVDGLLTRLHR